MEIHLCSKLRVEKNLIYISSMSLARALNSILVTMHDMLVDSAAKVLSQYS